jgi:hypothetical protein
MMKTLLPIVLLGCVSQPAPAGAFGRKPQPSWPEAMAAARAKLPEPAAENDLAVQAVRLGPWHTTGAVAGEKFAEASLGGRAVDLSAVRADGAALWSETEIIEDGRVCKFGRDSPKVEPVYFYRTITADCDSNPSAGFGSRNTLEVWVELP